MSVARLALAGARPYVSAAANASGNPRRALAVLDLIDKALAEYREAEQPQPAPAPEEAPGGEWSPPGGWAET